MGVLLQLNNVSKSYGEQKILDNIQFTIEQGDRVGILGKSGAGKTTLLNIISTIDTDFTGETLLFGEDLKTKNNDQLADIRAGRLGFVFQDYGLLSNLNVQENILFPAQVSGQVPKKDKYFNDLLEVLEIGQLLNKYPHEISGGEKQRAAMARAMLLRPQLLIADEPTGALDIFTGRNVLEYLKKLNEEYSVTIVIVTHDLLVADVCNSIFFLGAGKIQKTLHKKAYEDGTFRDAILESFKEVVNL